MADTDSVKDPKKFYEDIPMETPGFFLKGSGSLDWGMKNRLARIFNPESAKTVMLAIDHGYFQGPTTGLERIDLNIVPLMPYADALMLTRGILRTTVPPSITKPIVMRCSGGPSILKELSDEHLAVDIEDAIRMNVAAITLQVFIGGQYESSIWVCVTAYLRWRLLRLARRWPGMRNISAWPVVSVPNSVPRS